MPCDALAEDFAQAGGDGGGRNGRAFAFTVRFPLKPQRLPAIFTKPDRGALAAYRVVELQPPVTDVFRRVRWRLSLGGPFEIPILQQGVAKMGQARSLRHIHRSAFDM